MFSLLSYDEIEMLRARLNIKTDNFVKIQIEF